MGTKNNPGKFDCYAKADPDEPMFVLLARDPHAALLVNFWVILHDRDTSPDKLREALACVNAMDAWRERRERSIPYIDEHDWEADRDD